MLAFGDMDRRMKKSRVTYIRRLEIFERSFGAAKRIPRF
jgi:hypothetical protein